MKNDLNNEQLPKLTKKDFEFVNKGGFNKIHDEKIKTKPTTFAKDAFKRFCKNKSSVVGAIIIGVLLLASFIAPAVSPYSNLPTSVLTAQSLLVPKLFNAGTGAWDGCKTYDNQPFDRINEVPIGGPAPGFKDEAILKTTIGNDEITDSYYEYAWGGYNNMIAPRTFSEDKDPESTKYLIYTYNKTPFTVTDSNDMNVTVTFGDTDGVSGNMRSDYQRFSIYQAKSGTTRGEFVTSLSNGWVPFQTEYKFNLSDALKTAGISQVEEAYLMIEAKPKVNPSKTEKIYTYMLLKSVELSSSKASAMDLNLLNQISFKDRTIEEIKEAQKLGITLSDAHDVVGYYPDSSGKTPIGYWPSNGTRASYHALVRKCSVYYDLYQHVFGTTAMVIDQAKMQSYLDNKWCEFTGSTNKLSDYGDDNPLDINKYPFKVLDAEKCPVISVSAANYSKSTDNSSNGFYQFDTKTTFYKYCGMSSMPRYIFGTDAHGYDMLTLSLSCLKNSLLVAIIASAICMIIGLIWGSISGYFGGNVDLIMERITDIISGIPWIVMMTLIILLLGQSVVTFGIALVLTGWIGTASRTRTQFYRFRDREYVLASRTLGASDARLIFKHILPNGLGTIVTSSVLMIPSCIFSEATLSYLGLGLKGLDSFGVLLSQNQQYINTFPALVVWPALIVSLLMISFNLFGNGLRDALNPTLKGGEQ